MSKKVKEIKKILNPSEDVVKQDKYDKHMYTNLIKNQKALHREEDKLKAFYPPIFDLNRDVYTSLYKFKPEMNDIEMVKNTHRLNHTIIESITKAKKYEELRDSTKLDPILSMLGTSILQEEVKKTLEEKKDEIEKLQKEIEAAQQAVNNAMQKNGNGNSNDPNNKGKGKPGGTGNSEEKLTLKEAKKKLEDAKKNIDKFADIELKKSKINNLVSNVNKKVNEISDLISNWGLDQSFNYSYSGHEEKLAILDEIKNSHKLKAIAKFLGRLKMLKFREGTDKVNNGFEELSEITLSDNLDKMLSSEYNNLLDEDLKILFFQKYIDKKLLTYRLKSKTKNEVGSCVIAIDSSGSMSGDNEIWSKGLALGVLETMRAQKRDMFVIHFSGKGNKDKLHVNNFEVKNHHNIREILNLANYFEGGGTQFEPALSRARDIVESNENFSKADILFITDGQSAVSNKWLENFIKWKKEKHINVISILLDSYEACSTASVSEFSDKVYLLSDVMSDDGMGTALDILSSL